MKRSLAAAALATAALATAPAAAKAATPDPAIAWNQFLLSLQATTGNQPATIHPTYDLAIMHAAINDAVASIDRGTQPYLVNFRGPRDASPEAAADAAAHETLVKLYPALRTQIDQQYAAQLNLVPGGRGKLEGIATGTLVAAKVLQQRANDGSTATPPPFTPGTGPGEYQLTPPGFAPAQFTGWGRVRPFLLKRGNQFRPPAPPAVTSPKYQASLQEVQTLGAATGSTRTADQTQIGLFWNPPIWAAWNRIAETAAAAHHGTLATDAHVLAALNLTFADSVIAFYDAKYTYRVWRPVTAIRALLDNTWVPLSNTAPDPSYPGAHGTISAAAADVLAATYGNDFEFDADSSALPGVTRSFTSFTEAAEEASVSRIYNGNHTRIDQVAGENLGHDVAGWVLGRDRR